MAGTSSARRFSEEDKARIIATLAANGGNVKRTSRETDVDPSTIRRWRRQVTEGKGPSDVAITKAVTEFVDDAVRVRNKALVELEVHLDAGTMKPQELITTLGVLDDKITRAKGLPTSRVETTSTLPDRVALGELMAGFVAGAIAAAEARHEDIVDAEVVEEVTPALPSSTQ